MIKYILTILIGVSLLSEYSYSQVNTRSIIDSLINYGSKLSSDNHLEALKIIDSALVLCKRVNYQKGEAEALRKKGLALFYAINYNEALKLFIESKEKFEKINDQSGIANANNMIAIVYSYHGLNEKSLELHKENLALREKINDTSGISTSLNNIGVQLLHLNKLDEALIYYRKAIDIEVLNKDDYSISRYYDNIGSVFLKLKQPDSAIFYLSKALNIRNKLNDRQGIKNSLESLGDYYSYIGNYSLAKKYQEKSLEIAYEIGIVYEIESITFLLGQTYANLGEFEKAYNILMINRKMLDSLKSNETTDLLNKLEIQKAIASEKKIQRLSIEKSNTERKIQIDRQRNTRVLYFGSVFILVGIVIFTLYHLNNKRNHNRKLLEKQDEIISQRDEIFFQHESISSQNEILSQLNASKDKFFSIIAHDLKNPLGNFRDVTKLLAESYNELSEMERIDFLKLMKDSSKNIYELLENLLEWSRAQRGQIKFNPIEFNLKLVTTEVVKLLKHSSDNKMISLGNLIPESIQIIADINMIQTIIRNLISNAIKFTPENGTITIFAEQLQYEYLISVKDTGVGMSQESINKLFMINNNVSTNGTLGETGTGLGLILCKEFVEKHGGKIWVESEIGNGSTFYFNLPMRITN